MFISIINIILSICYQLIGQICSIAMNLYEGIIWFVFPSLLVICNDIFAYIWGKLIGRHRLIEISPKKTWEGFMGGGLTTLIVGIALGHLL